MLQEISPRVAHVCCEWKTGARPDFTNFVERSLWQSIGCDAVQSPIATRKRGSEERCSFGSTEVFFWFVKWKTFWGFNSTARLHWAVATLSNNWCLCIKCAKWSTAAWRERLSRDTIVERSNFLKAELHIFLAKLPLIRHSLISINTVLVTYPCLAWSWLHQPITPTTCC